MSAEMKATILTLIGEKEKRWPFRQDCCNKKGRTAEIEGCDNSFRVNWSVQARKHHITNKKGKIERNGEWIAQEFLVNNANSKGSINRSRQGRWYVKVRI